MTGIEILGTGSYLPGKVVHNEDFTAIVETSDEWITTRTGMKRRHIADLSEPAWRMGELAAQKALAAAALPPDKIDMIIATTVTPDYATPAVACLVQNAIKAENAFSFDINVACSGFTYALDMARRYLATGDVEHVLVVSTEWLTQLCDYEDRATCVLFGDGAGACVIKASEKRFASWLHCDTTGIAHVHSKNKRKGNPFLKEAAEPLMLFPTDTEEYIRMNGREVYKFATKAMPEAVTKACAKLGAKPTDLDWILPHQANLRIIETAMKNLNLPMEKVYVNIHEIANCSSATIAIALDDCAQNGGLKRGDLVCAVGFGAGLTYGASVFEY